MKKFLISLAAALLCGVTASAQQFTIRAEAGPAFSFSSLATHGVNILGSGTKIGYHVAGMVDVNLYKGLYASAGLSFEMKGAKGKLKEDNSLLGKIGSMINKEAQNEITMHYLQIPVNIGYKLSLTPNIGIGIQTGPYFAFGLGGTQNTGIKAADAVQSFNVFKEGIMGLNKVKRYDIGWGASAMAYFSNYYATVGADFGFLNIAESDTQGTVAQVANQVKGLSFKNSTVYVGIGYCF